ncbi:hypothetical protein G7K_2796-t1 [Saitoella complicata NRRL Y-17804]|uniref:DUF4218 domain-containing protein n=1 Tax=Saitoella complicata (strain BCRC 22490 / CBS 7301 / JCM 7358 / NBRC 10748 / NRRL Y-17804) TaxID=698492 RepID=A0A0E9NG15_SAICN|nr:hypothetical protein G7K_2796-t1 [Saitoella complicata NRRL Y-17804]
MSFGVDVMHLICDNLSRLLYNLWDGRLPAGTHAKAPDLAPGKLPAREHGPLERTDDTGDPDADPVAPVGPPAAERPAPRVPREAGPARTTKKARAKDPWVLTSKMWEEIGEDMRACRRRIPNQLGRAPRNIAKNSAGFKATEWSLWLSLYSVPLLSGRLPDEYLANWEKVCEAYNMSIAFEITVDELTKIRRIFKEFVLEYERLYYQYDYNRMSACPSSIHMLLHVADCIEWLGPAWVFWVFAMERMNGMVVPKARSRSELNKSLANAVLLDEQLKLFGYIRTTTPVFSMSVKPSPIHTCTYETPSGWFMKPEKLIQLSCTAHRHLVDYLQELDVRIKADQVDKTVRAYKRFQLCEGGDLIGSYESQRKSDKTRASNIVLYTHDSDFGTEVFFGEVMLFARPLVRRVYYPLAYIRCYGPAQLRRGRFFVVDTQPPGNLHEWVNIRQIKRVVGTLTTQPLIDELGGDAGKPAWIIDRETFAWNNAARLLID